MSQNEKKGTRRKAYTRPKKWSGDRRPAGPATTALFQIFIYFFFGLKKQMRRVINLDPRCVVGLTFKKHR